MAQSVAKSGMFGAKTTEQAMGLMLIAQAEGVHPMRAVQEYHVIQGRPAMKADAMLARFQAAGGRVNWEKYGDEGVTGTFSHAAGGSVRIEWTMARAKQAGLAGKDNWKSYPASMLRSRCISEGVRTVFPGVAVGIYTVEEVQDMDPVNVTPPTVEQAVQQTAAARPLSDSEVADHLMCIKEAGDAEGLRTAFGAAWKHATEAKDEQAKATFKAAYDTAKVSP
jgi:hypothetical protein